MTTAAHKAEWLRNNLKKGETYAGIILGQNGEKDYHLVLLPGEAENCTWSKAKEFAKKAGGELPTRREQSLLFANCREHFKPNWYWSGEQPAANSDCAWCQHFDHGYQSDYDTYLRLRARAVRRIPIE